MIENIPFPDVIEREAENNSPAERPPLTRVELAMEACDTLKFAKEAMEAVPTMKEVVCCVGGLPGHTKREACVRRIEDKWMIVVSDGTQQ